VISTPTYFAWPEPLLPPAFHGLAGEIVRAIEPHSESDPAGLLLQFLTAFGNVIGRGPHFKAEADRHSMNLFIVLVGETSKARKGTSWAHIRRLVAGIDFLWRDYCVQSGLSSGEGLIHAVRDANGVDGGALDKRLLVVETEFSSPLRMISRDGNTLSPVLRQAWDGETLQVMTKLSPAKATEAHVSLVAHITKDELRRELKRIDAGSGFGNRFLWVCVRRSKTLPEGGKLPASEFDRLTNHVTQAVEYAKSLGDYEIRRDAQATELWHSIYPDLSDGRPGLCGAITSRAEAQVMRLACLYAILDQASGIKEIHLRAALAVWEYCKASARLIFGDAFGDPLVDQLLEYLSASQGGLTRTEISGRFGHNRPSMEIDRALERLAIAGKAACRTDDTGGRPASRWFAVTSPAGSNYGVQHLPSSNSFNSYSNSLDSTINDSRQH